MNKKLLVAAIVGGTLLINSSLSAKAMGVDNRDVSTPADLNAAVQSNQGEVDVNLQNDVTVTGAIGTPNSTVFTVNGNGYALDGNKASPSDTQGQFAGFNIDTGKNLTIQDSTLKNFDTAGNSEDAGGAIHNLGTTNIYNSSFAGNTAQYGGAIYNEGTMSIYNSSFSNNIATRNYGDGGVINNNGGTTDGIIYIYNSSFSHNTSYGTGAITNYYTANIYNSYFNDNSSSYDAGAIYNDGTANIYNSYFTNNFTTNGNAGAIGNVGTLNLIADGSGIKFTGNTASGISNAINNAAGNLNLNAGPGQIIVDDKITGRVSYASININATNSQEPTVVSGAPTNGMVSFNNTVSGNNINLYNGMLTLGNYIKDNAVVSSGSINDSASTLTLNGGILNLANGFVGNQTINVNKLTINNSPSIWLDVDPTAGTSDKLTIASTPTINSGGKLNLKTFRMLNDAASASVTVSNQDISNANILVASKTYTNGYDYTIAKGGTAGTFTFTQSAPTNGLQDAVNDSVNGERSFSLVGSDYTATANLPKLTSGTLTVFGTGTTGAGAYAVSGGSTPYSTSNHRLFQVASGATLNIDEAILKNAYSYQTGAFPALNGGAALVNEGTTNIYDSLITNNVTTENGGAIINYGNLNIYDSQFSNNKAGASHLSGAMAIEGGSTNIYHSTFTGNGGSYAGGAIAREGGSLTISDSTFTQNSALAQGGAIYNQNNNAPINIYNSTFGGDSLTDANTAPDGGALYNSYYGIYNIYNSTFKNNTATNNGGAIANIQQSANDNTVVTIYDSTFKNNSATSGGAIYSKGGTVNLIANNKDVTFTDNTATSGGNDIYLISCYDSGTTTPATLNLNAALGNKITFNDGIKSASVDDGYININKTGSATVGFPPTSAPTSGEVVLNAPIETSTVNLYNGTLTLNRDNYLDGNVLSLYGGTLNMQNGAVGTMTLHDFAVVNQTNLKIDADLNAGTSDKITTTPSPSELGSGKINVSSINLINNPTVSSASTQLLDGDLKGHNLVTVSATRVYSPVYAYNVSYNDSTGKLTFTGGGGNSYSCYNPAVTSAGVSAQISGYLGALATYNEVLNRVDQPMLDTTLLQTQLGYDPKLLNKVAATEGGAAFSPLMEATKEPAAWFRPFSTFENVDLDNGPTVHNVSYGGLIGGDSGLKDLKHGYQYVITAYGGYTGSHQTYDGVSLYQNGGFGGLMGTLYKKDFFTALTTSVGADNISSNTSPDFGMLNAGVASRTGYNFRMFNNRVVFQPNYLMSYTFVGTQDYTNYAGVKISTDALNAIQIIPGAKLIFNLKHGWQPYLGVNMVWNLLDDSKVTANNISLPQVSVDPYVEYGVGVQKKIGNRFTGFFQSMIRNGGRNGVSLLAGLKWTI